MKPEQPALQDLDDLIAFLPVLYGDRTEPICVWHGGETEDGTLLMPFPEYADDVSAFFQLAGRLPWSDFSYRPQEAALMLADHVQLQTAGIPEIRTVLTYCVRGERFSSGFWESVIQNGDIRRILERLVQLREAGTLRLDDPSNA